jgi:hypothetical protein
MNTLPNLQKLLASATPGPLEIGYNGEGAPVLTFQARDICTVENYYKDGAHNARVLRASHNHLPALVKALASYDSATRAVILANNRGDLSAIADAATVLRDVAEQARAALAALEEDCK